MCIFHNDLSIFALCVHSVKYIFIPYNVRYLISKQMVFVTVLGKYNKERIKQMETVKAKLECHGVGYVEWKLPSGRLDFWGSV